MATTVSIAQTRDFAVASLKESSQEIAAALHIEPPDMSFFFRDKDYQQAEELKELAAFHLRIQTALKATVPQKEKVSHAKR